MPPIRLSPLLVLIASVAVVSIAAWAYKPLKRAFILEPMRVREHFEVHRLLTAGWLHGDAGHLFMNMLTLYLFADDVLRVLGTVQFMMLYVSAVVMAFVPTTLRHMRNARYASLGASGAVAAVVFSAVLLNPGLKLRLMFVPVALPALIYALLYLAYSAWHSYAARDGVNHDAHFSGAIYGAMFTAVFEPARVARTVKAFL